MPETPKDHGPDEPVTAPPEPAADRSRLITRWIGTGIGGALLVTVLVLAFARSCINSAQSHVMAVVLALGAALLLWGVVGGLKVDLKLRFKALGEVAAAGVAAIFLIVHFVSADGIISPGECKGEDPRDGIRVLYGRVFQHGAETKPVAGAKVKVELEEIKTRTTDDDGHFEIIVDGDITHVRVWVQKPGFYESVPVDEAVPLDKDKIRIPMVKLVPKGEPRPPIREFPTFVRDWNDPLVQATKSTFDRAAHKAKDDPVEAVNWARRAHAAGEWQRTSDFFDLAKAADPSGRTWFTDQGYLASAYKELGRVEDARTVRTAVEKAVEVGDPRVDADWYRVTSQDFDLYSARVVGGAGTFEPTVEDRLPGVGPREPKSAAGPRPTAEPKPTVELGPTVEPGVFDQPIHTSPREVEGTARLDGGVEPVVPLDQ